MCIFNLSFHPVNKARFLEYSAGSVLRRIILLHARKNTSVLPALPTRATYNSCDGLNEAEPAWFKLSKEFHSKLLSKPSEDIPIADGGDKTPSNTQQARIHAGIVDAVDESTVFAINPTGTVNNHYGVEQQPEINPAEEAMAALLTLTGQQAL